MADILNSAQKTKNSTLIGGIPMSDVIDKDILELLGVQKISEEERNKLYKKMLESIQNRVIARIDDKLNDSEREEFKKMLDDKNDKKINDWLKSKNIEIAKMLIEEAVIYKTELLSLAQAADQTTKQNQNKTQGE